MIGPNEVGRMEVERRRDIGRERGRGCVFDSRRNGRSAGMERQKWRVMWGKERVKWERSSRIPRDVAMWARVRVGIRVDGWVEG